jgi:CubicO group peptidase (beta-lactamase class C family)
MRLQESRGVASVAILFCAIVLSACLPSSTTEELAPIVNGEQGEAMHSALTRAHDEDGFSGAVVFERGGEVLLEAGYGLADRENNLPFTLETVAQIGSISKQFTATAALILVDEGILNLHVPISDYLPEAPAPGGNATLHQLMVHSSGLGPYCGSGDFEVMPLSRVIEECLARPLAFEPGSQSEYSNMGFSIVAAVIERVTGQTLESFLRQRVFLPNGMTHTGYLFEGDQDFAVGYLNDENHGVISDRIAEIAPNYWNLKGNGGIQSPAAEMRRWHEVLTGEGNLSPAVREALLTPRILSEGTQWVGYGWYLRQDEEGTLFEIAHAGSDGVFFSYFWADPTTETFFYIVGNSGEEVSLAAARAIFPIFRNRSAN